MTFTPETDGLVDAGVRTAAVVERALVNVTLAVRLVLAPSAVVNAVAHALQIDANALAAVELSRRPALRHIRRPCCRVGSQIAIAAIAAAAVFIGQIGTFGRRGAAQMFRNALTVVALKLIRPAGGEMQQRTVFLVGIVRANKKKEVVVVIFLFVPNFTPQKCRVSKCQISTFTSLCRHRTATTCERNSPRPNRRIPGPCKRKWKRSMSPAGNPFHRRHLNSQRRHRICNEKLELKNCFVDLNRIGERELHRSPPLAGHTSRIILVCAPERRLRRASDLRTVGAFVRSVAAVVLVVAHPTPLDAVSVGARELVGRASRILK